MSKIRDTENYTLVAGESTENNRDVYKLINRDYDIVEMETSILPEALSYMDTLQEALREEYKKNQPGDGDNVVKIT